MGQNELFKSRENAERQANELNENRNWIKENGLSSAKDPDCKKIWRVVKVAVVDLKKLGYGGVIWRDFVDSYRENDRHDVRVGDVAYIVETRNDKELIKDLGLLRLRE